MSAARTGLGADQPGFVHEALLYASDEEFAAAAVPFLRDGIEAGEPTLLGVDEPLQELVLAELGRDSGVVLIDPSRYARPYDALRRNREQLAELVDSGAAQVRMLGAVPAACASWHSWSRYEAAINHLLSDLPAWGVCPYDLRSTPDPVVEDVHRTHRHLTTPGAGHAANPRFIDPERFLARRALDDVDPLERRPPDLDIENPQLRAARHAIAQLAETTSLPLAAREDLVVAVDEVLTNAIKYGEPPVRLRAWRADDRIVAAVSDHGTGPDDPYAGMLPGDVRTGRGLGLHIAYQVATELTLTYSADEFTAHLTVRTEA